MFYNKTSKADILLRWKKYLDDRGYGANNEEWRQIKDFFKIASKVLKDTKK